MSRNAAPRAYLDANIVNYMIEGTEPFRARLGQLTDALDAGHLTAVTSELTIAEVMVKPFASADDKFIRSYRQLLGDSSALEMIPVSRAIIEESAMLRASMGGTLADGIHVATATVSKCLYFISEDAGIKAPSGLKLVSTSNVPALLADLDGTP